MKFAIVLILAVAAIVPALADGGKLYAEEREARIQKRLSKLPPEARARIEARRAKFAAMSPEELAEHRRKAMEARERDTAAARAKRTAEITAKLAAAKAACGQECYRVVFTNGVAVGMTKAQYDAYQAASASNKVIRARGSGKINTGGWTKRRSRANRRHNPTIKQ
jgi:hypothetical protein